MKTAANAAAQIGTDPNRLFQEGETIRAVVKKVNEE